MRTVTERERAVIETMRMRLRTQRALQYLEGVGHPMGESTYYRWKKRVNDTKLERLHQLAQMGYEDQHLERIEQLELAQRLMWENYFIERNSYKKTIILEKIVNVQPFLSSYYDATKQLVTKQEHDVKLIQKDNPIPQP